MFLHYGGPRCLPPHPLLCEPGVRGYTAGSPLVLSRFNSSGLQLASRWPVMFLPRRMITSMLRSALASAVILSLCRSRCYTEDTVVIEWTQMRATTHPAAHMSAGLSAQVPFILLLSRQVLLNWWNSKVGSIFSDLQDCLSKFLT